MADHPTPVGDPGQSSDDILGREPGGTDEIGPEQGGTDEIGPEPGGTDILRPGR